jgi:hypothetical protein
LIFKWFSFINTDLTADEAYIKGESDLMNLHWLKGFLATTLLLTLFVILNPPLAKAQMEADTDQDQTLVIGTGDIRDENVSNARNMAISEALVKGVEEYLTRRLGPQGMLNHFPRLLQDVIPHAKEWIVNYHILAEERINDHYKVLIRARVNDKLMEERLRKIGVDLIERPPIKVLFLVSQSQSPEGKLSYWWQAPEAGFVLTPVELALYNAFEAQGFHPVNRLLMMPEGKYSPGMKNLELTEEDAIGWGRLFSADMVIRGRCEVVQEREVALELQVLHVGNGSLIDWDRQIEVMDEPATEVDQVVETIGNLVSDMAARLSPKMWNTMQFQEATLRRIEFALLGLRSFSQFRAFKSFLENDISGVKSVKQTRVRDNTMFISVEFFGDEKRVIDMISTQTSLPFMTDVERTEEGEIFVTVR